jgi:hypothetical protein
VDRNIKGYLCSENGDTDMTSKKPNFMDIFFAGVRAGLATNQGRKINQRDLDVLGVKLPRD